MEEDMTGRTDDDGKGQKKTNPKRTKELETEEDMTGRKRKYRGG